MPPLRQLVESPALSQLLGYVARPRADPLVERVALIEDLGELDRVGDHAIVLLTRGASANARTYRFDMAMRLARNRTVAAIVLAAADAGRITPTSAATADRSDTAILATGGDVDLAELALAIGHELAGGADAALRRAHAALRAVQAHPANGRTESLLQRAGAELGVAIAVAEVEPKSGPRRPIVVEDRIEGWVTAAHQDGSLGLGVDLVLHAAAGAVADARARAGRAEAIPIQTREEVLTELLSAPPQSRAPLVLRARALGVPIDGWHVAARLEFDSLTDLSAEDELTIYHDRLRLGLTALQTLRRDGGTWHSARAGLALLLVRMSPDDPGIAAPGSVGKALDGALPALRAALPGTILRCGVGSAHEGPAGLLSSAAEARAAVTAARASGLANVAVPFDSVGLRRTLVEWYASDTAQEAVTTVLKPLTDLGGARAERLILTLHVYLDQRGSLTKTAEILNMHRNAVAYRVNQIFSLLDVDQDNPDDMLLVQLACRARRLA